jgi:hypothetical protein
VNVFQVEDYFSLALMLVMLGVEIFALVNSLLWSSEHYRVAGKLSKPAWVIILALAVAFQVLGLSLGAGGFGILSLGFLIAALVYLLDVRPALAGLRQR